MRRYPDCIRTDGMCGQCSMVNHGRDCHNNPINKLLYQRTAIGMTQAELAKKAGINIRMVQKYENEVASIENMSLKVATNICKVLGCELKDIY